MDIRTDIDEDDTVSAVIITTDDGVIELARTARDGFELTTSSGFVATLVVTAGQRIELETEDD